MAPTRPEPPLVSSILDRLLDDEPDVLREVLPSRGQQLQALKRAVRRDLQNLLNTRIRCLDVPPGLEEIKKSLVTYGIPDFTGAPLGSAPEREDLGRVLQAIVRRWEPRFKNVQVRLLDSAEPLDRTLRFQIDALLQVEPAPEPVVFSVRKLATGDFEVQGGDR
jgi:type VI secretion system protein ImpF